MLVWAQRTVSVLTTRALVYGGLFVGVVVLHLGLSAALREHGWNSGLALTASGGAVLGLVLVLFNLLERVRDWRAGRREMERVRQRLPGGPMCVVWRAPETTVDEDDDAMPWEVMGPLRARYPKLARRLGVEGVAIAEFEIGTDGRAKNIHCVEAWPSDVFYDSAREALEHARFQPKFDVHVRYGASYRIPFVFRISGAAKVKERGRRARKLRPSLHAAQQAVEKLRRAG